MTWSITCGIRRHGRDEAIYQTNDLLDMLKHIDKTAQNGIYVLCDAHPGFKDPISMRLIREIALSHSKSARTLVFISPRLDELPSEVLRLSAHFHPVLPDRDAIRILVQEEAKRYEKQTGERPRGDKHALEMLIMHLLGMEQDDVRRLVRQALRDDGAISEDDLRRVLATKYEALGGAASLAYEESKVKFADVGGLANSSIGSRCAENRFSIQAQSMSIGRRASCCLACRAAARASRRARWPASGACR